VEVQITSAQEHDFEGVYEILMHEGVNPFMNYPVLNREEFREIWNEIATKLFLWKSSEEIIGLIVITKGTYRVKHIAYIEKLAINQNLRSRGLGTKFFGFVINSLASQGITKVELGVEVDNLAAIDFYKKLGFEIEGVRKKLLDREGVFVDNYYMAKFL